MSEIPYLIASPTNWRTISSFQKQFLGILEAEFIMLCILCYTFGLYIKSFWSLPLEKLRKLEENSLSHSKKNYRQEKKGLVRVTHLWRKLFRKTSNKSVLWQVEAIKITFCNPFSLTNEKWSEIVFIWAKIGPSPPSPPMSSRPFFLNPAGWLLQTLTYIF